MFTAIDLFAGCGGLTCGLRDAGFRVVAAVEVAPLAAETFRANHTTVPLLERDIRSVSAGELQALLPAHVPLDLLAGCPPCQGFSDIRRRRSRLPVRDKRNSLIEEMARLALALNPNVVLLENVPSVATYYRFQAFRRSLKRHGYNVQTDIIDVAHFSVPQRRRRLVMVASKIGPIPAPSATFTLRTVRNAIGALDYGLADNDPLHSQNERRSQKTLCLIKAIPKDGGSRNSLPQVMKLQCHTRFQGFYDVYGRMAWDKPAPTITGGCVNPSKGRFLHPEKNRAITLREAALLQSFPVNYKFSLKRGKYAAAELIGNALPPLFARAQADAIMSHLSSVRSSVPSDGTESLAIPKDI